MKCLNRYAVNAYRATVANSTTYAVLAFSAADALVQVKTVYKGEYIRSVEPWIKSRHGDWPWAALEEEENV